MLDGRAPDPDLDDGGRHVRASGPDLHVALVEPEIPWNTGNVGRTALAVGARLHLVHPLGFDLDERGVRRAGLDYWRDVDLEEWPDWSTFENTLQGYDSVFLFSAEAERSIWDVEFTGRSMLIFGSETRGLRPDIRARYEELLVAIPMRAGAPGAARRVRSLNVSTAAAVALFEALRQRRDPQGERG